MKTDGRAFAGAQRPLKVLLVEDNDGDVRLLSELLTEVSGPQFELTRVERLAEMEERLSQQRFDLVLLDLSLPDSPGMWTLTEIHRHASRVPIVVLTGLEDDPVGIWTAQQGAQGYLVKGRADAYLLVDTMLNAIDRHQRHRASTAAVD